VESPGPGRCGCFQPGAGKKGAFTCDPDRERINGFHFLYRIFSYNTATLPSSFSQGKNRTMADTDPGAGINPLK